MQRNGTAIPTESAGRHSEYSLHGILLCKQYKRIYVPYNVLHSDRECGIVWMEKFHLSIPLDPSTLNTILSERMMSHCVTANLCGIVFFLMIHYTFTSASICIVHSRTPKIKTNFHLLYYPNRFGCLRGLWLDATYSSIYYIHLAEESL